MSQFIWQTLWQKFLEFEKIKEEVLNIKEDGVHRIKKLSKLNVFSSRKYKSKHTNLYKLNNN